jgi:hypothetical protein
MVETRAMIGLQLLIWSTLLRTDGESKLAISMCEVPARPALHVEQTVTAHGVLRVGIEHASLGGSGCSGKAAGAVL